MTSERPDTRLSIRRDYFVNGRPIREVAREHGVSVQRVGELCSDRTRCLGPWPLAVGSVPSHRALQAREGLREEPANAQQSTSASAGTAAPPVKHDPWERLGSR